MSAHVDRLRVFGEIKAALVAEQQYRHGHADWIERERLAVTAEANRQAVAHGWPTITVADVEAVEPRAMGHVDYTKKLALYVTDLICPPPSSAIPKGAP